MLHHLQHMLQSQARLLQAGPVQSHHAMSLMLFALCMPAAAMPSSRWDPPVTTQRMHESGIHSASNIHKETVLVSSDVPATLLMEAHNQSQDAFLAMWSV